MMLTKEECEMALTEIEYSLCELEEIKTGVVVNCLFDENLETIKQLIEEHFDNLPLKFDELKEGMWVWDNNWNQYFEICEIYPQTKEFDVLIHQNRINKLRYEPMKFEENRFYRKQVIQ